MTQISELADLIATHRSQHDPRERAKCVAALDLLAEDLVGQYSEQAVGLKKRIQEIIDTLCPRRDVL